MEKLFTIQKIEYLPSTLLRYIKRIELGGVQVRDKKDLDDLVEPPLLKPLKALYGKGIRTIQSSANLEGGVYFMIVKGSLDSLNLEKALGLGTELILHGTEETPVIKITYPDQDLTEVTFGDVENWGLNIVENFQNQRFVISSNSGN